MDITLIRIEISKALCYINAEIVNYKLRHYLKKTQKQNVFEFDLKWKIPQCEFYILLELVFVSHLNNEAFCNRKLRV